MSSKLTLYDASGNPVELSGDDISAFGIESGDDANGSWTKFPDGTLIQWGCMTEKKSTVYFPVQFVNSNVSVVASAKYTSTSSDVQGVSISSITNTSFYFDLSYGGSTSTSGCWQAIGRWK